MIIVIFLALVVSQAVPASANLANPSKSQTETRYDQLIGVNITPLNVKRGGTLTATGYVQGWFNNTPPAWSPAAGAEVHFDLVDPIGDTGWWQQASGTTDSNGYFSLTCQAPDAVGPYSYLIFVPAKGLEKGTHEGPWMITVY